MNIIRTVLQSIVLPSLVLPSLVLPSLVFLLPAFAQEKQAQEKPTGDKPAETQREWEINGAKYVGTMVNYDFERGVQLKMAGNGKVGFVALDKLGTVDRKYTLRNYAGLGVVQVVSLVKHRDPVEEDDDMDFSSSFHDFSYGGPSTPVPEDGWVKMGFGSGFMIGPRLLLTNHHVIRYAEKVRILYPQ